MLELQEHNMSWIEVQNGCHHMYMCMYVLVCVCVCVRAWLSWHRGGWRASDHAGLLFVCLLLLFIINCQAQFIKKAVDILCHCRHTLRYTYAFAFYLKKSNHTAIFEDNQSDLEMATETLSEYLERKITSSTISEMKIFMQDKSKSVSATMIGWAWHVWREGEES